MIIKNQGRVYLPQRKNMKPIDPPESFDHLQLSIGDKLKWKTGLAYSSLPAGDSEITVSRIVSTPAIVNGGNGLLTVADFGAFFELETPNGDKIPMEFIFDSRYFVKVDPSATENN